jgi:hypothetical protein
MRREKRSIYLQQAVSAATSPISTGWSTFTKTIGTDMVAFMGAIAADAAEATMTSTFNRTSSSASCGSWSGLSSVIRNSSCR